MSCFGLHEIHLSHVPFVLLLCCNLLRIGRPEENRTVTARPSGVVGGVPEVLYTVGCELCFLPRRQIPHPEVPVADKGLPLAIRRANPLRPRGLSPPNVSLAVGVNGARVRFAGSTNMYWDPSSVILRYQNLSPSSHLAVTVPPTTNCETLGARNFSARA